MLLISFDFQSCVMKPHLLWLPLHWRSYSISTGCQKGFFVSFFLSWFTEFCNSASLWFSWSVISASQTRKSAVGSVNFLKGKLPTFTQMEPLNLVGWLMTWGNHVLSYLKWKEEKINFWPLFLWTWYVSEMLSWWHWMLLMIKPLFYPKSKHSMSCIVNFLGSSSNWWRPWHSKSSREKGHKSSKQHTIILAKPSSSCCDSIMDALEFFWAFYDQLPILLCRQNEVFFKPISVSGPKNKIAQMETIFTVSDVSVPKLFYFTPWTPSVSSQKKQLKGWNSFWYNGPRRLLMEMR